MELNELRRRERRRTILLGILVALGCALTALQVQWTREISEAQTIRAAEWLRAALQRVAGDFNRELNEDLAGIRLDGVPLERAAREALFVQKVERLRARRGGRDPFRRYAMVVPQDGQAKLRTLDVTRQRLEDATWPAEWEGMRRQIETRIEGPAGGPRPWRAEALLMELPNFGPTRGGAPGQAGAMGELDWILVEADVTYYRDLVLPRWLGTHLGARYQDEYRVAVETGGAEGRGTRREAGATIFAPQMGPQAPGEGRAAGGPPGRWLLRVEARDGTGMAELWQWRNIALSFLILGLMLATAVAMHRASRRAEQLAAMQMNFVAGVSHELRTPLTVIRTAAFNLRGRLAARPEQVEKYGRLIQEESEKLGDIVEQVLRFASANSGQVIRERQAVDVQEVLESSLRSSRLALLGPKLQMERQVAPDLPPLFADAVAIRHVLANLLDNAVKYGTEGSDWIGVSAQAVREGEREFIEFRVADRGPGIPAEEAEKIFEPFFRGERALADQIHGTGLGLNLVKRIVEAHGGTIRVESPPEGGATFVVRIPVAPAEYRDEFAHSIG